MPTPRRLFGDASEKLAEAYLVERGYIVLDRQFLTRLGEIDLVMRHGDTIVFVEVKARHNDEYGYPEESVTRAKLRKIQQTARLYLRAKGLEDADYRIDVIAIEHQFDPPRITLIENAE